MSLSVKFDRNAFISEDFTPHLIAISVDRQVEFLPILSKIETILTQNLSKLEKKGTERPAFFAEKEIEVLNELKERLRNNYQESPQALAFMETFFVILQDASPVKKDFLAMDKTLLTLYTKQSELQNHLTTLKEQVKNLDAQVEDISQKINHINDQRRRGNRSSRNSSQRLRFIQTRSRLNAEKDKTVRTITSLDYELTQIKREINFSSK